MKEEKGAQVSIIVKNLIESNQIRVFLDGSKRAAGELASAAIGLGVYQPGWKWSKHAAPQTGEAAENHVGYIISGQMIIQDADGVQREVGPGDAFEVSPGHDGWVKGSEPCIALDFTAME